jgi:2-polyprenyl-6-hydroxyphenyl methylase/3-demethylubiquinone-9 3-methyltransferase
LKLTKSFEAELNKELTYDRLFEVMKARSSDYDTERRAYWLVDRFLYGKLYDKKVLDVGAGCGYATRKLINDLGDVTALDISPKMVEHLSHFCYAQQANIFDVCGYFGASAFDIVHSSECIEHTPNPPAAIRQMCWVLKPGGYLALSTPNLLWWPIVKLASILKLRPFDGYENFSTFAGLRKTLEDAGMEVIEARGLHLFPFQIPLHDLSGWCDIHLQCLKHLMINILILARKK